jgi:hypothetical protein
MTVIMYDTWGFHIDENLDRGLLSCDACYAAPVVGRSESSHGHSDYLGGGWSREADPYLLLFDVKSLSLLPIHVGSDAQINTTPPLPLVVCSLVLSSILDRVSEMDVNWKFGTCSGLYAKEVP